MIKHINNVYDGDIKIFIKMLIFGIKDYDHQIYKNITMLNIVQLFVISGLHLQILCLIINRLFKKYKKISFIINLLLILFVVYTLHFSISTLRVLVLFFISKIKFVKIIEYNYQKTSLNGLLLILINPTKAVTLSFVMIHICLLTIDCITLMIKNKYLIALLVNVLLYIMLLPIVSSFNGYTNPLSLFFVIVFSPFILFIFYFCLLFMWIPNFIVINLFIDILIWFVNMAVSFDSLWFINFNKNQQILFYLFMLFVQIYLLIINNKKKLIVKYPLN